MTQWTLQPICPTKLKKAIDSLDLVFALNGKRITQDRLSEMIYVRMGGTGYYIKRYCGAGKGIRRVLGRSRIRAEWENLQHFEHWGIPAARVQAYGAEKYGPFFKRGAIVTREILNTEDLAQLAENRDPRLQDPQWVQTVSTQIAQATRIMHEHKFAHGDLKWRNILVTKGDHPQIYLIDCPSGNFWHLPFLKYRRIKDLACLDKVACRVLSRTQRLRFYLVYCSQKRLMPINKRQLRQILNFFKGRE